MLLRGIKARTKKMGKVKGSAFIVHNIHIQKFNKRVRTTGQAIPNTTCTCRVRSFNFFFNFGEQKSKGWQRGKTFLFNLSCYCIAMNFWEALKFIYTIHSSCSSIWCKHTQYIICLVCKEMY